MKRHSTLNCGSYPDAGTSGTLPRPRYIHMYFVLAIPRDRARWPERIDRNANEIILRLLSAISRIQLGRFHTATEISPRRDNFIRDDRVCVAQVAVILSPLAVVQFANFEFTPGTREENLCLMSFGKNTHLIRQPCQGNV